MPASRQRSRSPSIACAVMAMIGRCSPVAAPARGSRAVASKPSMSGIWHVHQHHGRSCRGRARRAPRGRSRRRRPRSRAGRACASMTSWLTALSSATQHAPATQRAPRAARRGGSARHGRGSGARARRRRVSSSSRAAHRLGQVGVDAGLARRRASVGRVEVSITSRAAAGSASRRIARASSSPSIPGMLEVEHHELVRLARRRRRRA